MYLVFQIGSLLLISEKSAVQGLVLNGELISLTSIRSDISEVLDMPTAVEELRAYFTKYAWAAIEKRGMQ